MIIFLSVKREIQASEAQIRYFVYKKVSSPDHWYIKVRNDAFEQLLYGKQSRNKKVNTMDIL